METLQWAWNVWRVSSQMSQDGTRFSYWAFPYLLSLIRIFSVICLFWQTLTARDDTCTRQHPRQGRKYFTPKWHHLMLFFAGETSWAFALMLAFAAENIRKYTTRTLCSWKNLSSTCRQVWDYPWNQKLGWTESVLYHSLKDWNNLDKDIRNARDIVNFKYSTF